MMSENVCENLFRWWCFHRVFSVFFRVWPLPFTVSKLARIIKQASRVGGCERVFTPVRWRQLRLSCIKWRSNFFFLYLFVRPSFGRQFVIRVDGCCANCVVGLAFLLSGHPTRKTTSLWRYHHVVCPLGWLVRPAGLPGVGSLRASLRPRCEVDVDESLVEGAAVVISSHTLQWI